jgi:putative intracellular protease/amidase
MKITQLVIAFLIGILLTPLTVSGAPAPAAKRYVCPDCGCASDGKVFEKSGNCPSCNMPLIEKATQKQHERVTVAILLFDNAEIIDYAGPWEAFGEAGFKVFTVAENAKPVKATFGQRISPDYTFANSPGADILLVPGGGVRDAVRNKKLIAWVQKTAQSSKQVMSVCTGAFILARAGLLDGLSATTVSHSIDELAQAAPKTKVVHDQRYVDNGKIITTAGLSSGIDGAFHLIAKLKGKGTAQATALGMEYRWDSDSKFVRAALADRYFPEFDGVDAEVLSTEGDTDRWEFRALLSKPASVTEIMDLLGKRIKSGTPHTRGHVAVVPPSGQTPASPQKIDWTFSDDEDGAWNGTGMVEPAPDQPGKFLVTLKLQRQAKPNAT